MLDKPRYLSVEFNGDRLHNLHVFANPMETETYSKEEKGVMYLGRECIDLKICQTIR